MSMDGQALKTVTFGNGNPCDKATQGNKMGLLRQASSPAVPNCCYTDPRILGIAIEFGPLAAGYGKLMEIRR